MKRTWRPACGVRRLVQLLVALVVVMLATFAAAVVPPGGQPSSEATSTYDLASSIYDVSQRFSSATVDGTGMRRGSSSRPSPVAREGSEVVPRFVLAAKSAHAVPIGPGPANAWRTLDRVVEKGSPLPGYKGGAQFRNSQGRLPGADGSGSPLSFREWDVNPFVKGVDRGAERPVTGNDGSAFFTRDHYSSFVQIR